jgi:hypothetical protein
MKVKIDNLIITADFVDDVRSAKLKFTISDGTNEQEIDQEKVITLALLQIARSLKLKDW